MGGQPSAVFRVGNIEVDLEKRLVRVNGAEMDILFLRGKARKRPGASSKTEAMMS